MLQIKEKINCSGCYSCVNSCTIKSISMYADEDGFLYPTIDKNKCINCKLCEKVCPIQSQMTYFNDSFDKLTYGAYSINDEILKNSSSGGIFHVLAIKILKSGGVVFGAAFDNNYRKVKHIFITSEDEIYKLRGSKYIQSEIGNNYIYVKNFLDKGVKVLFSGTPCQIAGLYAFLGKQHKNLYTVDLICHGVPSEKVWNKYLDYQEYISGSKVKHIDFRNKNNGWKEYSIFIQFSNGRVYKEMYYKDLYMKTFLSNISLRPSCTSCKFKGEKHVSDITLGDFWGVEKLYPKIFNNKGTSLVILNSENGKELFENISNSIVKLAVDYALATKENSALLYSVKTHPLRNRFFYDLNHINFNVLVKKYIKTKKTLKEKIANILNKIGLWNVYISIKDIGQK